MKKHFSQIALLLSVGAIVLALATPAKAAGARVKTTTSTPPPATAGNNTSTFVSPP